MAAFDSDPTHQELLGVDSYFRAIWDSNADALVLSDSHGIVLAANQAYCTLYALAPEAVVGQSFAAIFPPDQRAWARTEYARTFSASDVRPQVDSLVQRSDGKECMVQTRYTFLERDGRRTAMLSAVRDVTDTRQSEEYLRAHLAALVASSDDAIFSKTLDGDITTWNAGAERLYGYTSAEAIGQSMALIVPPDRAAEVADVLTRIRRGERVTHFETERRHKAGHLVPVSVSISPIQTAGGQVVGAACIARDVTTLAQWEQTRTDVMASLAHDLKSPLSVISAQAQLLTRWLRRQPLNVDRLTAGVGRIQLSAGKMLRLLNDLADAARLEAGQALELQRGPVDLVSLVQDCVAEHQQVTTRHTLDLNLRVPSLVGEWDAARLDRVVSNLLSNAIKYSTDGSHVRVFVAGEQIEDRRWAVLRVEDAGIGIPARDLPHVMERFHRGSNVRRHIAGTGLGLAGARQIVDEHGGSIGVTSTEGAGTTVTVRLPLPAA